MTSLAKLSLIPKQIADVVIIEPKIFGDESSWFMESFNAEDLAVAIGSDVKFVQDNQSFSKQWTLRGIHLQAEHPQGKLVHVVQGAVFDVVVDVRKNSATYGKWFGVELSAENHKQLWIPPGLAHGFLVLSPTAEVFYKTTDYYYPQSELCLLWNDPEVGIIWPLADYIEPILSKKDQQGLLLKQLSDKL